MRIAIVQGTRPEIIKNYPIVQALHRANVPFVVLHTNQHYSDNMCCNIYEDMGYAPDHVMRNPYRLGTAINWLQDVFHRERITAVIVNGDTAASLAGALAAMYMDIPLSHVEAGLRSHDKNMYEERNRIMVDGIASQLFAYTDHEYRYLNNHSDIRGQIFCEGNTTVDVLHDFADHLATPITSGAYAYATMHRKEFTDSRERMLAAFWALKNIARHYCQVIFPIHPRTADAMQRFGIPRSCLSPVTIIEPVGAFESFNLVKYAHAVFTDSGCLQEEAYILKTPCVTIRENTERHLTVINGGNVVTGFSQTSIAKSIRWAMSERSLSLPDIYGTNGAGNRIVKRILGAGNENICNKANQCRMSRMSHIHSQARQPHHPSMRIAMRSW